MREANRDKVRAIRKENEQQLVAKFSLKSRVYIKWVIFTKTENLVVVNSNWGILVMGRTKGKKGARYSMI